MHEAFPAPLARGGVHVVADRLPSIPLPSPPRQGAPATGEAGQVRPERRLGRRALSALASPTSLTTVALAGVAVFRALVIAWHGEPSGVDFGNWLMFGHQALGDPLGRAAHVTYPPVVPVLAVGFVNMLGVVWGTALLAGLSSVAPAVGVFAACRLLGARWSAALAAVLLAATSSSGEAAAWGGVPQLIALGLAALALGLAQLVLTRRRWPEAAWLGAVLLALGATSHLILAQAAATLGFLVVLRFLLDHRSFTPLSWLGVNGWLSLSAIATLPMAVLVPLYLRLLPTVGQSFVSDQSGSNQSGIASFLSGLSVVYRDAPWLWKPALILTAVTPVLLFGRKHFAEPLWLVCTALVISLVAEGVLSGQTRLVYLAPIAVAFALVLWLSELANGTWPATAYRVAGRMRARTGICALVVAAVVFVSAEGLAFFPVQRAFYGALEPPGTMAGLDWLRGHTPANSLIAVAPVDGSPFGWWVQGYSRRAALVGSEDQWLNFPEERTRANEVVAMLSEPDPLDGATMALARSLGVEYFVLPWAWGGLSHDQLASFEEAHPGLAVFDNNAMVIVRVPPAPVISPPAHRRR